MNLLAVMTIVSLLTAALTPGSLLCHCPGHDTTTSSCQPASTPAKHSCCGDSMQPETTSSQSQGMTPGCRCGDVSNLNPFLPETDMDSRSRQDGTTPAASLYVDTFSADPGTYCNRTDVRAGPPGSAPGCTIAILRL